MCRQIEVTRKRGRRRKTLLDDLKDRRGYCQLKEEALDRTVWRNRLGRGFGPVVWQITDDDDDDDIYIYIYISRLLWSLSVHYRVIKGVCHWTLPVPDKSSRHPHVLFEIHFNIIFPSTPKSSKWSLRFSHQNPVLTSFLCVPHAPPLILLIYEEAIWWKLSFFTLLLLHPSLVLMFSSAPYSHTPTACVPH